MRIETDELMDRPLGVHPAQRVMANVKLSGVVADDDGIAQQTMRANASPQRSLGGDLDRLGLHLQRGDPQLHQMRPPLSLVGEALGRVVGQQRDDRRLRPRMY